MTIQQTLEAQLQQLGSRKVTVKEFPQSARWGKKFLAYTSLSGGSHTFIFLGSMGACRTGASPSNSTDAWRLKEKLLLRAEAQALRAKAAPKEFLSLSDL